MASSMVEMTCTTALAAFNAVMAADPKIIALGERSWGDVVYEEEQEQMRMMKVTKKARVVPTGPRCMVMSCSYIGEDIDEHGICTVCWSQPPANGCFKMREPSEMTITELDKALHDIDEARHEARRSGFDRWRMESLNERAQAVQGAKDLIVKNLDFSSV